jgi:metal-responsive CopG/Arc/MetJ family transcriptional regulator
MDFLVVEGKGEHIQKLYEECKAHGKMNVVRLVPL